MTATSVATPISPPPPRWNEDLPSDDERIAMARGACLLTRPDWTPDWVFASRRLTYSTKNAPEPSMIVPDDAMDRLRFDLATTGFGMSVGAVVGGKVGALIGAAAAYGWGRQRWNARQ